MVVITLVEYFEAAVSAFLLPNEEFSKKSARANYFNKRLPAIGSFHTLYIKLILVKSCPLPFLK